MRCFYFALTSILARVAGLRESVVPLLTWSGCLGIWPQPVKCLWENRCLRCCREFGAGCFHKYRLPLLIGVESEKCYTDLCLKLLRSSASSQSNVVFISGFSPSREQLSMK